MPFITQGKANVKYLLIVGFVAAIAGGIIFVVWNNCQKEINNLDNLIEIKKPLKKTESISEDTYDVYRITIKRKKETYEIEEWLNSYLARTFNLNLGLSSSTIMYDTRDGLPYEKLLDFSYYILAVNHKDKLKDKYEDENIIIEVAIADKRLIPYLKSDVYCETDEDCTIREEHEFACAYGAWNYYQRFWPVWGCENPNYPQEDREILQKMYDYETEHINIEYTNPRCMRHQCVPKSKTIKVEKGGGI